MSKRTLYPICSFFAVSCRLKLRIALAMGCLVDLSRYEFADHPPNSDVKRSLTLVASKNLLSLGVGKAGSASCASVISLTHQVDHFVLD